jgi:serine phosphatase RsbU (regulator of sigma subunit)
VLFKKLYLITILICLLIAAKSQQKYQNYSVDALVAKSMQLVKNKMPDSASKLLQMAKQRAKEQDDIEKAIKIHFLCADNYYWKIADYYKTRLEIDTLLKNYYQNLSDLQKCVAFSQYGDAIYYDQEYVRSVEYYYKALNFAGNDSNMLARLYHNLGWVYTDLKKYDKGIEFGKKALKIAERSHKNVNKELEGLVYMYMTSGQFKNALLCQERIIETDTSYRSIFFYHYQRSEIYRHWGKIDSALQTGTKALSMAKRANDDRSATMAYASLLEVCINDRYFNKISQYLTDYEKILQKYNSPYEAHLFYRNIGEYYLLKGEDKLAFQFLTKCLNLESKYKLQGIDKTYFLLSRWYEKNSNLQQSHVFLKKYSLIADSLREVEKYDATKAFDDYQKIAGMENDLFNKKAEINSNNLLLKHERNQKYFMLAALLFLLMLVAAFVKNLLDKRKTYKLLQNKNLQIEQKNKEILDSINYAKKIQEAMLPTMSEFKTLFPQSFILFKPKDIVAGDFFWITSTEEFNFFATVDCTGHGVPGGFMCMLGQSFLNEIIVERKIFAPAEVLNQLKMKIISALKQTGASGENKDGMDMVLCRIDKSTNVLTYASANHHFWIVSHSKSEKIIKEYKGNKSPVGISTANIASFSEHEVILQKGDIIYTFTDGYADQFGGPKDVMKGKKFKYKQLKQLILDISEKPLYEQEKHLNEVIEKWRGRLEQVDDILIIGVGL